MYQDKDISGQRYMWTERYLDRDIPVVHDPPDASFGRELQYLELWLDGIFIPSE